jgi:hypothetical protein
MNEFLKVLLNIRSLRAVCRDLTLEQLEEGLKSSPPSSMNVDKMNPPNARPVKSIKEICRICRNAEGRRDRSR